METECLLVIPAFRKDDIVLIPALGLRDIALIIKVFVCPLLEFEACG